MDCVFCKIAKGEIPTNKLYEDDDIIAFNDLNPEAPVHILIIPKVHIASLLEIDEANVQIISKIFLTAKHLAEKHGISENGFRIVTNCGEDGGQSVKHLHYHMLGGRSLGWPPG